MELSYYCLLGDNGVVIFIIIIVYLVRMEVSYYCLLGENGSVISCLLGDNGVVILLSTW